MNAAERWIYACDILLKQEGGLTNDSSDRGGLTNWGVSLRWLRAVGEDINGDGKVDESDIRALTETRSRELYKEYWWDKHNYNALNDLNIATKVLSLSVNMGESRAHKILQSAINRINVLSIGVDGIVGPKTIKAANELCPRVLLDEIKLNAAHFYMNLVWNNRKFEKFLLGWMRRAFD